MGDRAGSSPLGVDRFASVHRGDRSPPIRISLVNDYEVVLVGLAHMFDRFSDRVVVVEMDMRDPVLEDVDVALYDNFGQGEADQDDIQALIDNPHARRVAVYTWNFHQELVTAAVQRGVTGYLSKTLPADELVDALERVHRGELVISAPPRSECLAVGQEWPGRSDGLSERESEILAFITQGKSNAEVAALTYLSINSIKTYVRSIYRKIGASSRTQAVLWGVERGFLPQHRRIDVWRRS
jgi:DNA-binding NarL/FixJ family response regulator